MPIHLTHSKLDRSAGFFRRTLDYAFYDWTREMPKSKRVTTWVGILIQGYAVYAIITHSLVWPVIWPKGLALYPIVSLLYLLGNCLMNGMLTSEFVRKTQLESDQIAAQQIQQTLIPQELEELRGYDVETFYKPFRDVSGDYFDMIELPGDRTLFVVADVSGKGMAAALLAANIQALVRSIASLQTDPLVFARQINQHLSRYTPADRFATAVFVVLTRDSGELTYVNAGHNAPFVLCSGSTTRLEPTGLPLGLFTDRDYEAGMASIPPGGALLLFTDGLIDSIPGKNAEARLYEALADNSKRTMSNLKSLINPKFNKDDITILLIKRSAGSVSHDKPG